MQREQLLSGEHDGHEEEDDMGVLHEEMFHR